MSRGSPAIRPTRRRRCRCHDVRNLVIVDGSLFVTAAAVNPTNTIQALALYIADTIKERLATLFDDD